MSAKRRFHVSISYTYEVDMGSAEEEYGTDNPYEMAGIDEENFASSSVMLAEDLSKIEYKVAVEPEQLNHIEPRLIHYRDTLLRAAVRWQKTRLAHHPGATAEELIAVIDPDHKKG